MLLLVPESHERTPTPTLEMKAQLSEPYTPASTPNPPPPPHPGDYKPKTLNNLP